MKRRRRTPDRFITYTVECRDCGVCERKYGAASKMWREIFKQCEKCGSDRMAVTKVDE